MAKTNSKVFIAFTILALGLLILWYALGYVYLDSPVDIIITILWLLIILGSSLFLIRAELHRRATARTIYISNGQMFNFEAGILPLTERNNITGAIADVLDSLTYSMQAPRIKQVDDDPMKPLYIIKSHRYIRSGKIWEGAVIVVASEDEKPFSSRSELARIIIPLCCQGRLPRDEKTVEQAEKSAAEIADESVPKKAPEKAAEQETA